MKITFPVFGLVLLMASSLWAADLSSPQALGEALFFDVNLSRNRSQACASCHSPDHGFADPREIMGSRAASLGDDGRSIGDRNAPTASYARFVPPLARSADGKWRGGLFHDGRANTLEDQAAGPPLNPSEMGMTSKAAILERLKENADYVAAFPALYGAGVLADADSAYAAMTRAIAAFERTERFSPFDSRYDRSLRGEEKLTEQEELGRVLFFSRQFTNCNQCHQLRDQGGAMEETFTDYSHHNIGVPENRSLRKLNGAKRGTLDHGLLTVKNKDPALDGRFKTPTLRNVAVTGPYMHNGVFRDLRTVILFYNQYNSRSPRRRINPETGMVWDRPEVGRNISLAELRNNMPLDDRRIDALVAFLKTLTDRKYEHLLEK